MSKLAIKLDAVGTFRCTVEAPQYGWFDETTKGSRYIRIPCVVDEAGPHKGKKITWNGYLTSKAYENTEKVLEDVFGTNWTWTNIPFAGKQVVIVTEEEEYNGKTQIKARYLNSLDGPKRNGDDALHLSESIAKDLPSRSPSKPSKPAPQLAKEDDDDIPF